MSSSDPRAGWTTRIQNTSGVTLAGAPVIALHGFTGRGSDWNVLRERMQGHAWLMPDLPGHGPNPVIPADLSAHLDCVRRSLGFFTEAPVLLGYSMGARIALHAALDRAADWSALVLIGGTPGLESPEDRAARIASDAALAHRIRHLPLSEFFTEWDSRPILLGKELLPEPHLSRSREARLKNTPAGLAASLDGVGAGVLTPLWDALPDIDLPTILVTGERDTKFRDIAARMVAGNPHFAHVVIPSAGHAAHFERPAAVAEAIESRLAQLFAKDR